MGRQNDRMMFTFLFFYPYFSLLLFYFFTFILLCEGRQAVFSDMEIECIMENGIEEDVCRDDPCDRQMVEQRDIDEDEEERQQDDAEQCLMLCQSCPHQLMVNMVLVCTKDRTVVQQPDDDDPEDIEGGDDEQGHGEQDGIFLTDHYVRIVHTEFDKQDTEYIPEGQTA